MKPIINRFRLLFVTILFTGAAAVAQKSTSTNNLKTLNTTEMKTYIIERNIPAAGRLSAEQLRKIAVSSCAVLKEMGSDIEWIQSYVVADKFYCVYKAANEELIREHARRGDFPVTNIMEVKTVISPATAN